MTPRLSLPAAALLLSAVTASAGTIANVSYTPDRARLAPGQIVSIEVRIDVSAVNGACADGLSASLNGYQAAARFDTTVLELVDVQRCASSPAEFDRKPVFTKPALAARSGAVVALAHQDGRSTISEGCYATFRFRALRPGTTDVRFGATGLGGQKASLVCEASELLPVSIPDGSVRLTVAGKLAPVDLRVCQTLCMPTGKGGTSLEMLAQHSPSEADDLRKFLAEGPLGAVPGAAVYPSFAKEPVHERTVLPSGTNQIDFLYVLEDGSSQTASANLIVRNEGDLDEDQIVDIFDVVVASAYLVGNLPAALPPFTAPACCLETNGDGVLDIFDLVNLMGHVAGNVTCLQP